MTVQTEPETRFGQALLPGTRMIPPSDRHGTGFDPRRARLAENRDGYHLHSSGRRAGLWRLLGIPAQGNISKAALGAGSDKTEAAVNDSNDRMQILILGSDSRDGKNSQYGTSDDATGYGHSDVMMFMDISADNKRVSVVSFPRDLLVDTPKCTDQKTKKQFPAQQDVMINAAMTEAGIGLPSTRSTNSRASKSTTS